LFVVARELYAVSVFARKDDLGEVGGLDPMGDLETDCGLPESDRLLEIGNVDAVLVDAVSCTSVTGSLSISGPDITDLSPLSSVTSVGLTLGIVSNPVLTNLDGLAAVTSVGLTLIISDNAVLTNLDGLTAVTSVVTSLRILDNAVLTEFCGVFPLLDASGLSGIYTVSGNATNPTEADILAGGACTSSSVPALGPVGIALLLAALGATACWRLRDSASAA
jgi:hypothetical protein